MIWDFIWVLIFTLCCCSLVHSLNNTATESFNSLVQDFAFRSMVKHRHQTGDLYDALLPRNLSGMDVSVVRLRSRRLWNKGANFSYFRIPPRTVSIPHVRRLAIVYQNLGNWSSNFYNLPGYSLISSVVGFVVCNASNVRDKSFKNLTLNTMGKPISIHFPNVIFTSGINSRARCVAFSENGTFQLTVMSSPGVCHSRDQGHFSVVLPLQKKRRRRWYVWVIGCVLGFFGLITLGYVVFSSTMRFLKTKKIQTTEKQAIEDMVLESRWVGDSKMPSAAVTRTQPVLESIAP